MKKVDIARAAITMRVIPESEWIFGKYIENAIARVVISACTARL